MGILTFAVLGLLAFALGFWLTQALQNRRPSNPLSSQPGSLPRSSSGRFLQTGHLDPSLLHKLAQDVIVLLAKRQKIAAVKQVRERTGWDLQTAKDYVESLEHQEPIILKARTLPNPTADLPMQVRQLLDQRQTIAAIKLVRKQTGWSLKQAKAYVEQIQTQG